MCSFHCALRERHGDRMRARRGVSIILAVIILSALIAFVSLAVDFGRIRLVRAQLQTGADASARAGAFALPHSSDAVIDDAIHVATNSEVLDNDSSSNHRTNPGVELHSDEDIIIGIWHPADKEFEPLYDQGGTAQDERRAANAVWVHARRNDSRNNPVKLIFAPVVGVFSKQIEREAIAYITDGKSNFGFVGIDWVKSVGNYASIDSAVDGKNATGGGIASNGDIDLGNGDVYGDARAGGQLIQQGNSIVTGWTAKLDYDLSERYPADKYLPPIPFTNSTGGISPANTYNTNTHKFAANGNTIVTINAGIYRFEEWVDRGTGIVTVNGPSTFYIDGDFTMAGTTSNLVINAVNGPVKFFVNGNVELSGGNIVNPGSASNLTFSLTGAGTNLTFNGSSSTAAHFYAPLSSVTVLGTPGFTGWIIGKTLEFKGTSKLHYDESGTNATPFEIHLVK